MFFVYVLVSDVKGLRFYVGMSENVERRFLEHNSGETKSTKGYISWKLFFVEYFNSIIESRERETYLKSVQAKKKVKYDSVAQLDRATAF